MDFEKLLKTEKIANLSTSEAVVVSPKEPVKEVIRKMQGARTGCAVVAEDKKVAGIFTEQDALCRFLLNQVPAETPIEKLMTKKPKFLKKEDSVALAIRFMNEGKYRNLPIVDAEGDFIGLFSVRDIVEYLSELYPSDIYNLPPDPRQVAKQPEGG